MKKKILSLIIAVCIFVLPLTVISFAGDEDNSVLNSAFYIDTQEKTIRTAFSSDEYDEKTKKILEVLRKYGR